MKRPPFRPATAGLATAAVTSGATAATGADDLPVPSAALSLVCFTALAVTAVRRLITRAETAERRLTEERERRAHVEQEYADLVADYNDLIIEQAQDRGLIYRATGGQHSHGPRCQCRRRGPRPFLTLIDDARERQGSA
ncbi:hypothetical protein GR925_25715 [Streptomyces sp. HUCO-GS316]|uniref:hypothetical protein n=1 Tax=Streptomyces sp. HUCO-GS316 TaxID=2692198 RepID=UPI00136D0838|nr:hypothetical protein [Streptomyces sp. HUCO-GS316]MXM66734.1 hypothetical protein [Streptomyces sp. HUCO-GS316]